jgi:DNA-binding transcriptional regulator Cro
MPLLNLFKKLAIIFCICNNAFIINGGNMQISELIEFYGSDIKAAAALGFSHESFKNWVKSNEIPYPSQCVIQVETGGKFTAAKYLGEFNHVSTS